MARLRTNNVFGTTTNNPLLVAGVTLNSAGLANLPVITAPDVAVLTLDPNRVNGAPEIVYVTAHTGSATSATILRAQEGTAAREHPLSTFWVHAATVTDWGTAPAPWTPTLTNLTLGNGTVAANFSQTGFFVFFRFSFTFGSTSSIFGEPSFSAPVTADSGYNAAITIGQVRPTDANAADWTGVCHLTNSTTIRMRYIDGASNEAAISSTAPFTWVATDLLTATGFYQVA